MVEPEKVSSPISPSPSPTPPTATTTPESTANPKPTPQNAPPKGNPAFRAMGLPNFRLRLPSRNWLIFITLVSSWTGAVLYDKRQKRLLQQKWCTLVSHVAKEPLATNMMDRRVTIVLGAPPGDGIRSVREHFTEYVKPVLVAGGLDWDVVEGRREGEVRRGVAERIRRVRRRMGEVAVTEVERDVDGALAEMRERTGIEEYPGVGGDIVVGRHSWKEYVRGTHEGWLGSIDPPKEEKPLKEEIPGGVKQEQKQSEAQPNPRHTEEPPADEQAQQSAATGEDGSPTAPDPPKEEKKDEPKKPDKPVIPTPHNMPASYADSKLPPSIPAELSPASPIQFPHILGFLNTPKRIWRFLNRRHLADDIGRQTAAAVLAAHRPFREDEPATPEHDSNSQEHSLAHWEQQGILEGEEKDWHKSARVEKEGERVWLDDVVIDPRIGRRMRKFELEPGDEERAREIWRGSKGIPGRREGDKGDLERESS